MPCQLLADCLDEIFEYLEEDKVTLYSCLLVNHLWCEVSVRILWRHLDNRNIKTKILSTLIACLPDESKELLHKNGIFISTPTSKPLLFNYASFCKALSVDEIGKLVEIFFKSQQTSRNSSRNKNLVVQEIFKMFMIQTSLKKISYEPWNGMNKISNFTQFPGAKDCLAGLSILSYKCNAYSEFCHQLSQICHNIQSINVEFKGTFSNGLIRLISSQNSLKCFSLTLSYINHVYNWADIATSLMRSSNTLIKLKIKNYDIDLNGLQYVNFPQLQFFRLGYLRYGENGDNKDFIIKFLETNGKNLKKFYVSPCSKSVSLAIAKFCPNLKSLCTGFINEKGGLEALKTIFHNCGQLEKIKVMCDDEFLYKGDIFEIVVKHSPKNFHELELNSDWIRYLSRELGSFFYDWKNRNPQKPISFIVVNDLWNLDLVDEIMELFEKYKKLGAIKKFRIKRRNLY